MRFPIFSHIRQFPRHAWAVFRSPNTPALTKTGMLLALAYILSPLDLIPDWLPVWGISDDLALIVAFICWLKSIKVP